MEKEALFREIISEEKTLRNKMKFKTNDIQEDLADDLLSMAKQMKNNMLAMQATVGTDLSVHLNDTSQSTIGNQMKFMTNEISHINDTVYKLHQKNKDEFFFSYLFIFSTILFIISFFSLFISSSYLFLFLFSLRIFFYPLFCFFIK